jgi:hypothetical protein
MPCAAYSVVIHIGRDPLFYPAKPSAHWLMCAEVSGRVLVRRSAGSRGFLQLSLFASHRSCSTRSVGVPKPMTGRCPPGSATQSSMNFAILPDTTGLTVPIHGPRDLVEFT